MDMTWVPYFDRLASWLGSDLATSVVIVIAVLLGTAVFRIVWFLFGWFAKSLGIALGLVISCVALVILLQPILKDL